MDTEVELGKECAQTWPSRLGNLKLSSVRSFRSESSHDSEI
jgi:hypothetical protein